VPTPLRAASLWPLELREHRANWVGRSLSYPNSQEPLERVTALRDSSRVQGPSKPRHGLPHQNLKRRSARLVAPVVRL
jgi:hypothetical protein